MLNKGDFKPQMGERLLPFGPQGNPYVLDGGCTSVGRWEWFLESPAPGAAVAGDIVKKLWPCPAHLSKVGTRLCISYWRGRSLSLTELQKKERELQSHSFFSLFI